MSLSSQHPGISTKSCLIFFRCVASILCLSSSHFVFSQNRLSQTNEEVSSHLFINTGFTQFKNRSTSTESGTSSGTLGGVTGSIGFKYGLKDFFGLGANFEQAFQNGFSPMYSMIEVGATVPFVGTLRSNRKTLLDSGRPILTSQSFSPFVLRSEIFVAQYFLNSGKQVIGLAGGGAGLVTEFHLTRTWGLGLFVKYSYVSNPTLPATTLKLGGSLVLTL